LSVEARGGDQIAAIVASNGMASAGVGRSTLFSTRARMVPERSVNDADGKLVIELQADRIARRRD